MKLSDAALGAALGSEPPEPDGEDVGGDAVFESAAADAFEMWEAGKKDEAIASLKGAIQACVADYMGSDEEEQ